MQKRTTGETSVCPRRQASGAEVLQYNGKKQGLSIYFYCDRDDVTSTYWEGLS